MHTLGTVARRPARPYRFRLFFVAPTVLLLAVAMLPLITGGGTLYLRDVLHSHYPLKAAQAELMSAGELPLVDPYRAGGQPLLGNPNGLPLYPDNLLYLVASPLYALNAHFWLHLLLAPFAGYWLGRAWGLRREAAWATGAIYATSGYFFSQLNLYNLVAGSALAPAFIAAALDAGRRRRSWLPAGLLWALLVLAGDPSLAVLAAMLAAAALAVRLAGHRGAWRRLWLPASLALVAGTLLTAPMWIETLRILPQSFRGHWQYPLRAVLAQSWDPRTAIEWLLPLAFGPPDLSFWGQRFFGGNPPLFYSLFPGPLALALIAALGRAAGRRGASEYPSRLRPALWAWTSIAIGGFLALGFWNPLLRALVALPGGGLLRYPIKAWLAVAIGAALLCGLGYESLRAPTGRRRLGLALGALALIYAGFFTLLLFLPAALAARLGTIGGERFQLAAERPRWLVTTTLVLLTVALLSGAYLVLRRRRQAGGALLVAIHVATQCVLLQPLFDTDAVAPYRTPPPALAAVGPGERAVHGGGGALFGDAAAQAHTATLESLPDRRTLWLSRGYFASLYPFAGVQWGRRYDFNPSPEGLDSFAAVSWTRAARLLDDAARVRLLAAAGVEVLLLDRPLDLAAQDLVVLRATFPGLGHDLRVYELRRPAADVALLGDVRRAPFMNDALRLATDPAFDPRTTVVLPGDGPDAAGRPGRVEVVEATTERLEVRTASNDPGYLVTQRAFLPIYRATVDGEESAPEVANGQRLAVAVPAGEHRVRLWVDRRPTYAAWLLAGATALGLVVFRRRLVTRPRRGG